MKFLFFFSLCYRCICVFVSITLFKINCTFEVPETWSNGYSAKPMNEDINKVFCINTPRLALRRKRCLIRAFSWTLSSGVVIERLASMSSLVVSQERGDGRCCRFESRERLLWVTSPLALTGDWFFSFAMQNCVFIISVRTLGSSAQWKGWLSQLSTAAASSPVLLSGSPAHLGHQLLTSCSAAGASDGRGGEAIPASAACLQYIACGLVRTVSH